MNKAETLHEKIDFFIREQGYDWSVEGIMEQYEKYKRGEYISHSASRVVKEIIIKFVEL